MEKKLQVFGSSICGFEGMYQNLISFKCASGSGVEHHLAKVGAAGSNPVSRLLKCKKILVMLGFSFFMDFSLLSPLEFFVVPKNGDGRNNKPPAMRVRVDCYTKNHLSVYNRVVQAVLQKGKVIYGEERKFTCAYEMDVQISYRLHT